MHALERDVASVADFGVTNDLMADVDLPSIGLPAVNTTHRLWISHKNVLSRGNRCHCVLPTI